MLPSKSFRRYVVAGFLCCVLVSGYQVFSALIVQDGRFVFVAPPTQVPAVDDPGSPPTPAPRMLQTNVPAADEKGTSHQRAAVEVTAEELSANLLGDSESSIKSTQQGFGHSHGQEVLSLELRTSHHEIRLGDRAKFQTEHDDSASSLGKSRLLHTLWTAQEMFRANPLVNFNSSQDFMTPPTTVPFESHAVGFSIIIECDECTEPLFAAIAAQYCEQRTWLQRIHFFSLYSEFQSKFPHAICARIGVQERIFKSSGSVDRMLLYRTAAEMQEDAIFLYRVDQSIAAALLPLDQINDMYRVWRHNHQHVIVGVYPFSVSKKMLSTELTVQHVNAGNQFVYDPSTQLLKCLFIRHGYNMMATDAVMMNRRIFAGLLSPKFSAGLDVVNAARECEDVLMNFVAADLNPSTASVLFYDVISRPALRVRHGEPLTTQLQQCLLDLRASTVHPLPNLQYHTSRRIATTAGQSSNLVEMACSPSITMAKMSDIPVNEESAHDELQISPEPFSLQDDRHWLDMAHEPAASTDMPVRVLIMAGAMSNIDERGLNLLHHLGYLFVSLGSHIHVTVVHASCFDLEELETIRHFVHVENLHFFDSCQYGVVGTNITDLIVQTYERVQPVLLVGIGTDVIDELVRLKIHQLSMTWLIVEPWSHQWELVLTREKWELLRGTQMALLMASSFELPYWMAVNETVHFLPPMLLPVTSRNVRQVPSEMRICITSDQLVVPEHAQQLKRAMEELHKQEVYVRLNILSVRITHTLHSNDTVAKTTWPPEWTKIVSEPVNDQSVISFFSDSCDLGYFPSTIHRLSELTLQAFITGLPVLSQTSSSVGGVLFDLIPRSQHRLVFHRRSNIEALADSIHNLLTNPADYAASSQISAHIAAPFYLSNVRHNLEFLLGTIPLRPGEVIDAKLSKYRLDLATASQIVFYEPPVTPRCAMTIVAIMDTFTYHCFSAEANVIRLSSNPEEWLQDLETHQPSLIFIESIWERPWAGLFKADPKYEYLTTLALLVLEWATQRGIPSIFWNKEDPPNFNYFIGHPVLKMVTHIFTSEKRCVPHYKAILRHERVTVLPFAAQPLIHNPMFSARLRLGMYAFAGTYAYRLKYAHRGPELDNMLFPALPAGLTVFDRNLRDGHVYPDTYIHRFPTAVQERGSVLNSLPYERMRRAYKQYSVFMSVNSVRDSDSMFSRRVFEISASGTPVMSNPSPALTKFFGPDGIAVIHERADAEQAVKIFENVLERQRMTLTAQRRIFAEHSYENRLDTIMQRVNISHKCPRLSVGVSLLACGFSHRVKNVDASCGDLAELSALVAAFGSQTHPAKVLVVVVSSALTVCTATAATKWLSSSSWSALDIRFLQSPTADISHAVCLDLVRHQSISLQRFTLFVNTGDIYGPHFLQDLVDAARFSRAAIVGKAAFYMLARRGHQLLELVQPDLEQEFVTVLPPHGAVLFETVLLDTILLKSSLASWLANCSQAGVISYSANRWNYVHVHPSLDPKLVQSASVQI